MFRKYEKTYRIPVPQYKVKGKLFLSKQQTKDLMTGVITIEEKLDGANVGVITTKQDPGFRLQKRGSLVGSSEHEQFNYFVNWAHENGNKFRDMPDGLYIYFELMYARHNIFYDRLPDYLILTDIFFNNTYNGGYNDGPTKRLFCSQYGFFPAPLLFEGSGFARTGLVDMIVKSGFSSDQTMEGIVVKNYRKQMRGKVVRPDFMKDIDESDHWMTAPLQKNEVIP